MTSAIVYFGVPPKAGQQINSDLSAMGIDLLRCQLSSLNMCTLPSYIQPHYAIYVDYLPLFLHSRINDIILNTGVSPYVGLTHTTLPSFFRMPPVVWNYNATQSPDRIDEIKNKYNASEITVRGKNAFLADLSLAQVREIISQNPIMTTASLSTNINLSTLRSFLAINRIVDLFLRVHQYPAYKDNTGTNLPLWHNSVKMAVPVVADDGDALQTQSTATIQTQQGTSGTFIIHSNVFQDPTTFDYNVRVAADLPADTSGLIFPYLAMLQRPDNETVPYVIETFFMGLLGTNREEANEEMNNIRSAWGNLVDTEWGNVLTHLFFMIKICLSSQTTIRVILGENNLYAGVVLLGGEFSIFMRDLEYKPVSAAELASEFHKASPHDSSLTRIFSSMFFSDQVSRDAAMLTVNSIGDIAHLINSHPVPEPQKAEVRRLAMNLKFTGQDYLPSNAHNISRVFRAMNDTSISLGLFPRHPYTLFEQERRYILLSAFGSFVPSFNVPGGKIMKLENSFEVEDRTAKGVVSKRTVSKIAVLNVPFEQGKKDLDDMIKDKTVKNPFGNALGNRKSTQSIVRSLEGKSAQDVISALRAMVGVSMIGSSGAGTGKRKADGSGPSQKRQKGMDF